MADKKHILTYAGLKKYEDELQDLKVNRRREIAQKIKEAREQGDLSENAEYDAAKDEQRDIEARIEELEKLLKNAEVVVEDEINLDKISVGCVVRVYDMEFDEEGNLLFKSTADEEDLLYDDIACGLLVKKNQYEKRDLLESLEMFYKVFFLGLDE